MTFSRITTLMTTNQILGEINQSQNALATTEQQLSTGKTINAPSDNPYGAALAVQLNGQLAQLNDYNSNIVDGQAWTQTGSTAISAMQSDVQRAQELVTEAANGTMSPSQLNDVGAELTQIVAAIKSSANTQYNGQYVFSGTATSTPAYDASGSYLSGGAYSPVTRQIGPASQSTVSVDLSQALGTNTDPATGSGLLSELGAIANNLSSGSPSTSGLSAALSDIQDGLSKLSSLATNLGAATDQMTMASTTISDMQTSVTADLSNDEDANMATTMTTYSNEEAAFTAALKAGASIVQTSLMDFLTG
ncbi:MAG TPA: flagellar hook-associated protein FlgL [Solirubrobacteraceae bacterium]|nr:flagellar hook-associated protein FlgL [Solirubrobacteraceae bacterium]